MIILPVVGTKQLGSSYARDVMMDAVACALWLAPDPRQAKLYAVAATTIPVTTTITVAAVVVLVVVGGGGDEVRRGRRS